MKHRLSRSFTAVSLIGLAAMLGCSSGTDTSDGASSGGDGATGGPTGATQAASSTGSATASSGATTGSGAGGSGAGGAGSGGAAGEGGSGGTPAPKPVRLLVIGDTGEGNSEQHCVADAMDKKCELLGGCDAVVMTGDNFYDHGVQSVSDAQWMSKFELPYDRPHLNGLKFYVVLGNHDYGATSNGNKGAQIAYSKLPVGSGPGQRYSDKWTMPASYYDVALGEGTVHLFGIDTQDTGTTQLDDMKQRVAKSTAAWKIVFGHHPRYTSGEHQLDNTLVDTLTKLTSPPGMFALQEGIYCGADLYLTGHDHNREVIDKGMDGACPNVPFIISGAGAKVRPSKYPKLGKSLYYDEGVEGFLYFELTKSSFRVESYDMAPSDCAGAGAKAPKFTYGPLAK